MHKPFSLEKVKSYNSPEFPVRKNIRVRRLLRPAVTAAISGGILFMAGCHFQVEEEEQPEPCDTVGVTCLSDNQVLVCNQDHEEETLQCDSWCVETYGADYVSYGCQNDINNPCFCEYDMLLGVEQECYPGDLMCSDGDIMVCSEENGYPSYTTKECNTYCQETFGADYISYGACDMNDAENPCNCDYDVLEGDMAYCDQGDLYCPDGQTVAICEDGIDYTFTNCDEKCVAEYGEGAVSSGCDAADTANPCGCGQPE